MIPAHQFGQDSEQLIANLLQKENFTILEQNYKQFYGEIDIIAKKDDILIFVEVKARKNSIQSMFGLVPPSKQKKIIKVAQSYIMQHQITDMVCRFDVALISLQQKNTPDISYIENAFTQGEQ